MPVSCEPSSLSQAAGGFQGLPQGAKLDILIYLFCRLTSVSCDPNALSAAASCFCGLGMSQKWDVLLYLACQIANSGEVCITGGVGAPTIPVPCNFSAYVEQPGPNFGFWLGDMANGWQQVITQGP